MMVLSWHCPGQVATKNCVLRHARSTPVIEPHIGCATPCGVRLSARQRRRFILLIFADGTRGLARLAGALVWRPRLKMMLYVTGS